MPVSCGLLMYVEPKERLRVLLVHPGGPYWRGKDKGVWSVPKGLAEPGEHLIAAAEREFREETGLAVYPPFLLLTPVKQKGGKVIHCWAFAGEEDLSAFKSGMFEMEWPPRSGRVASFEEADAARLFGIDEALARIVPGQAPFVKELAVLLG